MVRLFPVFLQHSACFALRHNRPCKSLMFANHSVLRPKRTHVVPDLGNHLPAGGRQPLVPCDCLCEPRHPAQTRKPNRITFRAWGRGQWQTFRSPDAKERFLWLLGREADTLRAWNTATHATYTGQNGLSTAISAAIACTSLTIIASGWEHALEAELTNSLCFSYSPLDFWSGPASLTAYPTSPYWSCTTTITSSTWTAVSEKPSASSHPPA